MENIDPRFKHLNCLYIAVFNCRESDKRKGRKAVLDKFGVTGWKKVLKINRTGIMAMFQSKPTPETKLYTDTVGVAAEARVARTNAKLEIEAWLEKRGRKITVKAPNS